MNKTLLQQLLIPILNDLNIASNEDFLIQQKVLAKTRHKLEELEKKLAKLEEMT
jgi:BMFP domain-containing protein YqiC